MAKNNENGFKIGFYIILLILLFTLLFRYHLNGVTEYVNIVINPIKTKIYEISYNVKETVNNIIFIKDIIDENERLYKQTYQNVLKDITIKELKEENRRLKELLEIKEYTTHEFIVASISYRNALEIYENMYVDKGKIDDIEKDMVVMYRDKLLGKITNVYKDYSKVELITKKDFFVSVLTGDEKNLGILKGNNSDKMILENIIVDAKVKVGEEVITSGISDIYPKGISAGKITKIEEENENLYKTIHVSQEYNILNVSEVLILKPESVQFNESEENVEKNSN